MLGLSEFLALNSPPATHMPFPLLDFPLSTCQRGRGWAGCCVSLGMPVSKQEAPAALSASEFCRNAGQHIKLVRKETEFSEVRGHCHAPTMVRRIAVLSLCHSRYLLGVSHSGKYEDPCPRLRVMQQGASALDAHSCFLSRPSLRLSPSTPPRHISSLNVWSNHVTSA